MPLVQTKGSASAQGVGQFARQAPVGNYIEDVFSTYLYKGTAATQTITNGIDFLGKGGMVWIKARTAQPIYNDHMVWATDVNGGFRYLQTNLTEIWTTGGNGGGVLDATGRKSNGFQLASTNLAANDNTVPYVSWSFRKQAKFFDVVTYAGNGATPQTLNHSLGSVPGCIIVKGASGSGTSWNVYHRSIGETQNIDFGVGPAYASPNTWNSVAPTATQFTIGNDGAVNSAAITTYVAFLFAHDAGGFGAAGTDNVISCGSFTTDGSGNATVTLGWEPQWIMRKSSSSSATGWEIGDNMRGLLAPPAGSPFLTANTNLPESSLGTRVFGPTATGFTATGSPSTTYIYVAIRRGPMRTPTSGTSVFASTLDSAFISAIPYVDMWINRDRVGTYSTNFFWTNRLVGMNQNTSSQSALYLNSNSTAAETRFATQRPYYDYVTQDKSYYAAGSSPVSWLFRRAPGFFDVVCYTGTGAARTVSHNLGAVPELMIVKCRSATATNWVVYAASEGATAFAYLNLTNAWDLPSPSLWNSTTPTNSVFSLGTANLVNGSGSTYVAYLFASCLGVSKVGSYTGTGTTQQINCGFTGGARFVMIKRKDSTGDWYVWDSARGIVAGNDPYLLLNGTAAEVGSTDYIDTLSTGFEISSTAPAAINANGGSYIFLAIA